MTERHRRGALWLVSLALTLSLFIPKGHETPPGGGSVAFVHGGSRARTVRLAGDVPHPGVYEVGEPATVQELLRQTAPGMAARVTGERPALSPLADGDLVTVSEGPGGVVTLSRGIIPARERLVLGIPLDPARMSGADWEALPGIGPALTARIMARARHRGGLRTLDDLRGVDGIGERTLDRLRPLFDGSIQHPGARSQK